MIEQPYRYLLKAILISFVLATVFYAVLNSEVACTDEGCAGYKSAEINYTYSNTLLILIHIPNLKIVYLGYQFVVHLVAH